MSMTMLIVCGVMGGALLLLLVWLFVEAAVWIIRKTGG